MFLFIYEEIITTREEIQTMGYAIFTARKLMLTNRINQMNFRMMQLTQQQQTLADSAAKMEQAISNTKSLFSNIGNAVAMSQQQMGNALQYQMLQNLQKGQNVDPALVGRLGSMLGGGGFMNSNAGMALNLMNQSLELTSQNQLRQVKDMENSIELERKNLETQAKAMDAELKKVEEAEDKQIQNSAPKFA